MVQVTVVPKELADLLHNAAILAEVPEDTLGLDLVLLEVSEHKLTALAAGSHTAGRGSIDLVGDNEQGEASVMITADEAMALQSAVRKTSSAKSAAIIVTIDEEGQEYHTEDGDSYLANFIVTWKDEDLCALPDVDPEGVTSDHWDLLEEMLAMQPEPVSSISFTQKSIGVLGKLKPPREFVTLKMNSGRYCTAYTEGWTIAIADSRPDLKALADLKRIPSRAD